MKIGCVVMAAGQGRRFGENKLLAPLAGKPVLAHVLQALPLDRLERVVAVTGNDCVRQLCLGFGVSTCSNESGLLSESVRRGIGAMGGLDGCLFVMGDQPLCSTPSMSAMLDAFSADPEHIIRLCYQDRPGSPVLFPRRLFRRLEALTGEQGGMAAVRGCEEEIRLLQAASEAELWDVDTVRDLARIEDYLRNPAPQGS